MAQMNFNLNDDLDKEFRNTVFRTKGMVRGNISEAIHEAIELWIREHSEMKTRTK